VKKSPEQEAAEKAARFEISEKIIKAALTEKTGGLMKLDAAILADYVAGVDDLKFSESTANDIAERLATAEGKVQEQKAQFESFKSQVCELGKQALQALPPIKEIVELTDTEPAKKSN